MATNKPNKIIVHHFGGTDAQPLADSSNSTAQDVDMWHKQRWPGFTSKVFKNANGRFFHVGYHFIIEKDGTIVQCRDVFEEGAHVIGQNTSSIGICLAGNFDVTMPTKAQLKSFVKLFNDIVLKYPEFGITKGTIFPHRKYAVKTCYGNNLSDTFFNDLIQGEDITTTNTELQMRVVQLLTQLYSLLKSKRYSNKQVQ